MDLPLNVVIALCRCNRQKQLFGIRIEEKFSGRWLADWAFPVQEQQAKREGYGSSEIRGSIELDAAYPGCPYCENRSFFRCHCDKITCWDGSSREVTCAWCGIQTSLSGKPVTDLRVGGDI